MTRRRAAVVVSAMRASFRLVPALLLMLLAGCAPADPLETPIKAGTGGAFLMWRGKIESRLSEAERAELVAALQELKLAVMREAKGAPATMLDARVRAQIDGRPLRELYVDACNARLLRLAPERAALRQALAHNHQIGGSDRASADFIAVRVERQTERLAAIEVEIAAAEARLRELGATVPPENPAVDSPPAKATAR